MNDEELKQELLDLRAHVIARIAQRRGRTVTPEDVLRMLPAKTNEETFDRTARWELATERGSEVDFPVTTLGTRCGMSTDKNLDSSGMNEASPVAESQKPPGSEATVSIAVTASPYVNVAFHHNAIPFLREIKIESHGLADGLRDITLSLRSDPSFLKPKGWNIAYLPADGTVSLSDLDVVLDGGLLAGLSEACAAVVTFALRKGDVELARHDVQTRLLAPDEWGGISVLPEILAAFVRPNDSAVETVLKAAAEVLRKAGRQPGLDGYQSDRRERAWEIAAAIWSAVCGLRLDYGNLWRRLALPKAIGNWSLTSVQQRLVKTGGRLIKHARYYWLLLAESHLTRRLFAGMLHKIAALPLPAG